MVDIEDVIAYLNARAADAYAAGEKSSTPYGWAYSTAATRLFGAMLEGEFDTREAD